MVRGRAAVPCSGGLAGRMEVEMDKPLISVIIPVYNILDCLERCVASVCAQTWEGLEILLVDDGSTDGTEALCDRLGEKDARIRVFHKPNGGSSSARNLGISQARGSFLGFVDSDDYIEPDMYERMMEQMGRNGCRMVQVSRDEIDEDGKRRPDVCTPPARITFQDSQSFLRELLLHRGDCSFCTKLIDRRLFDNRSFPEGELNEDFRLLVDMLQEAEGVCILPQQAYHVYYRMGSNTRRKDRNDFSRVFTDIVNNADYAQRIVDARFPILHKEAVRFGLYQRLDYLLHIPVARMNRENSFYQAVKKHCRAHLLDTIRSPFLTGRQKIYLLLLTAAPRTVRAAHSRIMDWRRAGQ